MNVVELGAADPESQYFIPFFDKNFMTLFSSLLHLILESQYFIPFFNKNFMTLRTTAIVQEGMMKHQMRGATQTQQSMIMALHITLYCQ
jgi:hypothetical protein